MECISASKATNKITQNIERTRVELDDLINQLEFDMDYKRIKDIDEKVLLLKQNFDHSLIKYKELLTGNMFLLKQSEVPIQEVFGELGVLGESVIF